jgi:hypothetical protein
MQHELPHVYLPLFSQAHAPFSCHHAHVLKNISNDLLQIGFPFLRVLHPNIPLLLPQHNVFSNKTHVMPLPYSG